MIAYMCYRHNEEPKKLELFSRIEEKRWKEGYKVEHFSCPTSRIPVEHVDALYLTCVGGNYGVLADKFRAINPDVRIYDLDDGEIEKDYVEKNRTPRATIVEFTSEPWWKTIFWASLEKGLEASGFAVDRVHMASNRTVERPKSSDIVFQWASKERQKAIWNKYTALNENCTCVCVEHGYWERDKQCMLMPDFKRIGLNGHGDYLQFRRNLDKRRKAYIIPMQLGGDEQLKDLECHQSIQQWVIDTYKRLKECTGKPVYVRPHPVVKSCGLTDEIPKEDILPLGDGNRWQENTLDRDLAQAYAWVTWNSTSGVEAMLHGVPVIQMGDRPEINDYVYNDITPEICQDIEKKGKRTTDMLKKYNDILPLLAGQQKSASELESIDYRKFLKVTNEQEVL